MSLVQLGTPIRNPKRARVASSSTMETNDGVNEVGQGDPVVNPPPNIPHCYNDKFTVYVDYVDTNQKMTTYDGGMVHVWKMNDIYDPDHTGTGHQPYFTDVWKSIYDKYAVLSCEYDITLVNCSNENITFSSGGSYRQRPACLIANFAKSTSVSDITDGAVGLTSGTVYGLSERKYVQTKIMLPSQHGHASAVTFKGVLTPGDFPMDAVDGDDDEQWTAVGSSPALPRYFGVVVNPFQQTAFTGQSIKPIHLVEVFVKLRYTVQFGKVNTSLREVES